MESPEFVQINFSEHSIPEDIEDKNKISEVPVERKCSLKSCNNVSCTKPWHRPCVNACPGVLRKIWPMILIIGIMEFCFGIILVVVVTLYRYDYDKIYGTENSRIISKSTFAGLMTLALSGLLLLVSLILEKRRLMWTMSIFVITKELKNYFRIMFSMALGVYIFVLSILKIHFALLAIERDPFVIISQNQFLLSTACVLGISTLLGSVIHFTGNVAVFTYYNLRFIHPLMFDHDHTSHTA